MKSVDVFALYLSVPNNHIFVVLYQKQKPIISKQLKWKILNGVEHRNLQSIL